MPFIEPDWPAPARVQALCTTRAGGCSAAPFDSLNLATHVGDDEKAVTANRAALAAVLPVGARIQWLEQVHGRSVVEAAATGTAPQADAAWSGDALLACAVMTADCLPVLLCDQGGSRVAAAHAGWRGLAAGVLEATLAGMGSDPAQVLAWLGPAIGPSAFEVGPEVRSAYLDTAGPHEVQTAACFRSNPLRDGYFFADLYALARLQLAASGVDRVYGGGLCTYGDSGRFFSYRRDGITGRMASLILLR